MSVKVKYGKSSENISVTETLFVKVYFCFRQTTHGPKIAT